MPTNRFVLKHGDELVPLPAYLKLFEGETYLRCMSASWRRDCSRADVLGGVLHRGVLGDLLPEVDQRPLHTEPGL